jgi:hypothetical protein
MQFKKLWGLFAVLSVVVLCGFISQSGQVFATNDQSSVVVANQGQLAADQTVAVAHYEAAIATNANHFGQYDKENNTEIALQPVADTTAIALKISCVAVLSDNFANVAATTDSPPLYEGSLIVATRAPKEVQGGPAHHQEHQGFIT